MSKKNETQVVETKVQRDRFGARLGTRAAKINAVLTDKPQTAKQITDKVQESAVYNHLHGLQVKGVIQKNEEGFFVPKSKKAPAKKSKKAPAKAVEQEQQPEQK